MRLFTTSLFVFVCTIILVAQTPQKFNYQAVARDFQGNILSNQLVSFRISILQGSSSGISVYSESFQPMTNDFGLANLEIGNGTILSGNFSSIDWSSGSYFLRIEMDVSGGSTYLLMGTSQLLSVPYSLYSENTANTDDADADPDNELNTSLVMNGNSLEITDDGGTLAVDLGTISGDSDWTISGDDMYSSVAGNVGIGTTTPSAILDVAGRISISNTGQSVFVGYQAGQSDDLTNNNNTFIGYRSGAFNTSGSLNTAYGSQTLLVNTTGGTNTALGHVSLANNIDGNANTAVGTSAMYHNTTGGANSALGLFALKNNTTGNYNTAIGNYALNNTISGNNNTAIGYRAGQGTEGISTTGCVFVGYNAGHHENTDNKLYIENSSSSEPLIYGEFDNDIITINGNLGIGTHSPNVKLQVVDGTDASLASGGYIVTGLTDGQNIVLDENEIMARNNGASNSLHLQRDGGALSVHYGLGEINEFRIVADGKTGIGENSPSSKLHINTASGEDGLRIQIDGYTKFKVASNGSVALYNPTSPTYALQLLNNSSNLIGKGLAYAWSTYSDKRLKSKQKELEYGLTEVLQLQPKSYYHHSSESQEDGTMLMVGNQKTSSIGFIAQEVNEIIPEAVNEPEDETINLWSMDYDKLIPVLTKAIQEQQAIIEAMQLEILALQNKE